MGLIGSIKDLGGEILSHIANKLNPHGVTSKQVLPDQTGKNGKVLGTNGSEVLWTDAGSGSGDMTKEVYDPTGQNSDAFDMANMIENENATGSLILRTAERTKIAAAEVIANKRASFQVTPDDTHYPSEKLVKDFLDLKDVIRTSIYWDANNNPQDPSNTENSIFIGEKGIPTSAGTISLDNMPINTLFYVQIMEIQNSETVTMSSPTNPSSKFYPMEQSSFMFTDADNGRVLILYWEINNNINDKCWVLYDSANNGSGEANTASNLGDGTGVYKQKSGLDLQFRSIASSDGTVQIDLSPDGNKILLAVAPVAITAALLVPLGLELISNIGLVVFNFSTSGIIQG